MTPNDAVNEGLLADEIESAIHITIRRRNEVGRVVSENLMPDHRKQIVAALRAVPSPDTVGVREALKLAEDVLSRAPFSTGVWPNGMHPQTGITKIRDAIAALSPSHCTAGRREEIARIIEPTAYHLRDELAKEESQGFPNYATGKDLADKQIDIARTKADAILALSEQSGLTAGREEVWEAVSKNVKERLGENDGMWRSCSGCYETEDGQNVHGYPHSDVFGCTLGGGCSECGGIGAVWDTTDYAAMDEKLSLEIFTPSPPDWQQDQDETSVLPSAEPVAWRHRETDNSWILTPDRKYGSSQPLYASPPVSDASREALTEDQVMQAIRNSHLNEAARKALTAAVWKDGIDIDVPSFWAMQFAQAILALTQENESEGAR